MFRAVIPVYGNIFSSNGKISVLKQSSIWSTKSYLLVFLYNKRTFLRSSLGTNSLPNVRKMGNREMRNRENASILRHSSKTQQNSGKFAKLFKHSDANRNFTRTKQETLLLLSVAVELQKLWHFEDSSPTLLIIFISSVLNSSNK